ncbi:hypothetical protein V7S76_04500 [Aquirufa sp. ROCK2-A2]
MFNTISKAFIRIFSFGFLTISIFACNSEQIDMSKVDAELSSLKDHEAKILVKIDGEKFYSDSSTFSGSVQLRSSSIRANLYDAKRSNVIFSVMANDWFKKSKKVFQVKNGETTSVNVLVGKITHAAQNKGLGYLFVNGECEIVSFTQDQLVAKFEGLTSEYMSISDPSKWQKIQGLIIIKKPDYQLMELSETDYFSAK